MARNFDQAYAFKFTSDSRGRVRMNIPDSVPTMGFLTLCQILANLSSDVVGKALSHRTLSTGLSVQDTQFFLPERGFDSFWP